MVRAFGQGLMVLWAVGGLIQGAAGQEAFAPVAEKGAMKLQVPVGARFAFGGVLGERIEANLRNWLLVAPRANPGLTEMFRTRETVQSPGLMDWAGEFVGKYLISAVQARRMVKSPELDGIIRQVVDELIAAQAEDGYLGPFPKDERLLKYWDLWGHYHVMLGLLMVAEEMDYPAARTAALKAADLICTTYLDGKRRVFDAGSQEMNMAVVHVFGRLYRLTGRERYLKMMRQVEEDWQRAGDYFRTGLAGVEFYKTPRPRWESLHDLQGLVEFYRITGQKDYATAFANLWGSIRKYDRHNSGSFSTGEGAIGSPYRRGAIETCCTTAWMAISVDMLGLSGDPSVADELELSTYNAVLASQHPSGRWWTYDTPMDGQREASAHTIVFQARAGTPELNCCSVNGPRGLGMLSEWAVMVDDAGPVVNHYGPEEVSLKLKDGTLLTLVEETQYPVEGKVVLKVRPERVARFALRLRIPAWSAKTQVTLNGEPVPNVQAGTYCAIEREWSASDVVELTLDMGPRFVMGAEEKAGRVSIYSGPLLLAFDEHYNAYGCGAMPRLDVKKIELKAAKVQDAFSPVKFVETVGADGRVVRLCDFATAGAHGNRYRSWLRTTDETQAAERIIIEAELNGDGQPARGKLVAARGIEPATDRAGKAGGAVRFNGQDAKLQYAVEGFPDEEYSVCAWVRVEALASKMYQQVFSAWAKGGDDPLRVCVMGDTLSARIEAGRVYATPGVKIEAGRWMHVAAVKEGGELRLYVDGELRGTVGVPEVITSAAREVAIGANPKFAGDEYLDGEMDGFSLWGTALSGERVRQLAGTAPSSAAKP